MSSALKGLNSKKDIPISISKVYCIKERSETSVP